MPKPEPLKKIILERRLQMHMTQQELADAVGSHQQTINKLERGQIKFSRYTDKLERALELAPGTLTNPEPRKRSGPRKKGKQRKPTRSNDRSPLPLFQTTPGNDEGTMVVATRHHGYTDRPSPLHNIPEGYGVLISVPSVGFDAGDIVWLNPIERVQNNVDALLRTEDGTSVLGRLLDHSNSYWVIIEWKNFPKAQGRERKLDRAEFPHFHRVVGRLCR